MKKFIVILGLLVVGVIVTTSLGSSQNSPEALCENAFKAMYGDELQGFVVTKKTWNSISYDLSGKYNNGEWACALSNNPVEFQSGILFPRDSGADSFRNSDIP